MHLPIVNFKAANVSLQELSVYESALHAEVLRAKAAAQLDYETPYASINLPLDAQHIAQAKRTAVRYKNTALLIVVGIGGSNLGTMAVQEALLGKLHNLMPHKKPQILYADTVDPDSMHATCELLASTMKKGKKAVINVISKSGATTETVANAEVLFAVLEKYNKRAWKQQVVVTTDEGSALWHLAKNEGFTVLTIPKNVGGRYSVFSPVGLFPLAMLGIDITKLLDGAAHMRSQCLSTTLHDNPAALRAMLLAHHWSHGRVIADQFFFKTDLESIGKWYRQLMGESIGKQWNKEHTKELWMGITPTVSVGSTDLHSMAQLYFGGPNDKLFTMVTVQHWNTEKNKILVPKNPLYDALVPHIQHVALKDIMLAIEEGVAITLSHYDRPMMHIILHDTSALSIGALLQLYMMEIIYLAALVDVNPFDQPNVESYKIETKKILARK